MNIVCFVVLCCVCLWQSNLLSHTPQGFFTGTGAIPMLSLCNSKERFMETNIWGVTNIWLDTLRPRQHGHHFAEDIFKWIFLMKMHEFSLRFHWNLFLRFKLTTFQHGLDNGLAQTRWQAIIWTNDAWFTDANMCHSASFSLVIRLVTEYILVHLPEIPEKVSLAANFETWPQNCWIRCVHIEKGGY